MNLPMWDSISEAEKEKSIGRRLSDGAPLTGRVESDPMDLDAHDAAGRLMIPLNAHARRAASQGTVFLAYTTNIAERFSPVLARLAAVDALNKWTTPVGSATFVIPPVWSAGSFLAQELIEG
jgi:dye decolorizing peroxidase